MSDLVVGFLLALASILVVAVVILVAYAIPVLQDLRRTLQMVRETLTQLSPKADETMENLRLASGALVHGAAAFSNLGDSLSSLSAIGRKGSLWGAALAGLAGVYSAIRRRRATREPGD